TDRASTNDGSCLEKRFRRRSLRCAPPARRISCLDCGKERRSEHILRVAEFLGLRAVLSGGGMPKFEVRKKTEIRNSKSDFRSIEPQARNPRVRVHSSKFTVPGIALPSFMLALLFVVSAILRSGADEQADACDLAFH